jgi:putative transcriptional regulator
MKCFNCGKDKARLVKRDHRFTESGLDSVTVKGCEFIVCPSCGEESLQLRKPAKLLREIARQLVFKPGPLTANEVKFLRDHVDWTNRQLAALMNVSEEQTSRWTTGSGTGTSMNASAEELFRVLVFVECMTESELRQAVGQIKALVARPDKVKLKRAKAAKSPAAMVIKLAA